MSHLEVKIQLMKQVPKIPFKPVAVEAATLIGVAAALVQFFACGQKVSRGRR